MRIFLDANVLFSAAKSDGGMRAFLRVLAASGHELCADGYVVEEARRNLSAKEPHAAAALQHVLSHVTVDAAQSGDVALEASLPLPPKDRPVLAAAIRLRCNILVTGDRTHFGTLFGRAIQGVTIHSPRSLAETLLL